MALYSKKYFDHGVSTSTGNFGYVHCEDLVSGGARLNPLNAEVLHSDPESILNVTSNDSGIVVTDELIAIGNDITPDITGVGNIIIGSDGTTPITSGYDNICLGYTATSGAASTNNISIGHRCNTGGDYSVGIGANCTTFNDDPISIGSMSYCDGVNGAISIGDSSAAYTHCVALGESSIAGMPHAVSLGKSIISSGEGSVVIGSTGRVMSDFNVAIGHGAVSNFLNRSVLGAFSRNLLGSGTVYSIKIGSLTPGYELRIFDSQVASIFRMVIIMYPPGAFTVAVNDLLNGCAVCDATAPNNSITFPTGTSITSAHSGLSIGDAFRFKISNSSAVNNFIFASVAGLTFFGTNNIPKMTSIVMFFRKTGTSTYDVYI